ncbi:MAG TPA: hypothetical protein VF533_14890, partial [Solirubrobacteraceae bacterium]
MSPLARQLADSYRRLPIRWRLAGGSAALTLVILLGFATIVGVLTTRQVRAEFDDQVAAAADDLSRQVSVRMVSGHARVIKKVRLPDYARTQRATILVVLPGGDLLAASSLDAPRFPPPGFGPTIEAGGYRIETRPIPFRYANGYVTRAYVQYGRRLSDIRATTRKIRVFIGIGVLGGTALALLAGLATARRAMSPIAELTEAARRIER